MEIQRSQTVDGALRDSREVVRQRGRLDRMRRSLEAALGETASLRAVEEQAEELGDLRRDLTDQLERAKDAAVICLVGSTGAGKSTLLNALVGRDVATEGVNRPTTSAPVIYRPSDADVSAIVRDLPGEAPQVVSYDPAEAATIGGAEAFWRGQILIDAPDVNSIETLHRDVVQELSRRADVLVVACHRQSIAELSSATFVDMFAERRGMVFVLGRRDELEPQACASLLEQLQGLAADRWKSPGAPVLAISARVAKSDPDGGGLAELRACLSKLIESERLGGVRRSNAIGNVSRIAAVMDEIRDEQEAHFESLAASLEDGASQWLGALVSSIHERLDVRTGDLSRMLWNDAAKVWDGPGGYALRVGGLSALGMGAGAAVARRNPVLAAGLAVGSVAADRMRGAVRERQFESTSGLLPGASKMDGFQHESFLKARLDADTLFLPDEANAMTPESAELDGHATRAVDEAWDRLVRVELPREAGRGVPWILRAAVDLPVYGLAVWVLSRVVVGFARESYVGLDFLLSALIIALAWLFGARMIVRSRLRAKGASILQGVREDIEQRVGAAARTAIAGRLGRLAHVRRALEETATADRAWRQQLHGEQ